MYTIINNMITLHFALLVVKIVLALIALALAISRGKCDKQIMFYWILVFLYWTLNALTDFLK